MNNTFYKILLNKKQMEQEKPNLLTKYNYSKYE